VARLDRLQSGGANHRQPAARRPISQGFDGRSDRAYWTGQADGYRQALAEQAPDPEVIAPEVDPAELPEPPFDPAELAAFLGDGTWEASAGLDPPVDPSEGAQIAPEGSQEAERPFLGPPLATDWADPPTIGARLARSLEPTRVDASCRPQPKRRPNGRRWLAAVALACLAACGGAVEARRLVHHRQGRPALVESPMVRIATGPDMIPVKPPKRKRHHKHHRAPKWEPELMADPPTGPVQPPPLVLVP
jgi:hypothetical protein